jgi:hypothetical protein
LDNPFITETGDGFASSVALSGNALVVGVPYKDSSNDGGGETGNSAPNAGAAYAWP